MAKEKSVILGLDFKEAIDLVFNIGSKSIKKLPFYYILKLIAKVSEKDPKFESIMNNPGIDHISLDTLKLLKNASELPEEIKLSIVRNNEKIPGTIKIWEAGRLYHRIKDPDTLKNFWKIHIETQPIRNVLQNIVQMIEKGETLDEAVRVAAITITGRPLYGSFVGAISKKESTIIIKKQKYEESLLANFLLENRILNEKELEKVKLGLGDTKFSIHGPIIHIDKINEFYNTIENDFSKYLVDI